MASGVRYLDDPAYGSIYNNARFKTLCTHDWESLSARHCSDRRFLQLEPYLWKPHISLPLCVIYSDAQGELALIGTVYQY